MPLSHIYPYYYSQRGRGYSEELTAWLAAGTAAGHTLPSTTVRDALDALLTTALETGTVASRMKTGYIFHAGSKDMAKLNLKDPATYPLTETNTVAFSEGNGCRSNGTNSYFNQPFKSNEFAGIESDITFIDYVSESSATASGTASIYGFRNNTTEYTTIRPLSAASTSQVYNYYSSLFSPANSGNNHKGLYVITNNGGSVHVYRDGTKASAVRTPIAPTYSQNRLILARNDNAGNGLSATNFYPYYVAVDFIFDMFSDTDESNFRTAFNTYKTAVSLP